MSAHTPGPWEMAEHGIDGNRSVEVQTLSALPVAVMSFCGRAEANAAFIVRACNNHDDLVATLQIIADHLAKAEKFAAVEYSDELLVPYHDIEKYARQALAKARLL